MKSNRLRSEHAPQTSANLQIPMINNPAQQPVDRKPHWWLPSLALLAVPLITLMLPAFGPATFATKAELFPPVVVRVPCPPEVPKTTVCSAEGLSPDAQRFYGFVENIAYGWLAERGLPKEDLAAIVRPYGREDLRAEILSYTAARLLTLLAKLPEKRTPDEQFVVDTIARDFRENELTLYDYAVKDAESFINDPCGWKPDPEIAAAYGLEYDGRPYCSNRNNIGTLFRFHIPGPKSDYLYAAAFKKTYGTQAPLVSAIMRDNIGGHLAATATATVVGGLAGGIIGKNISQFAPYAVQYGVENGWTQAASNAFKLRYTRFLGGGAFGIVTFMANIGIEAIIAFAEEVKFQEDLDRFRATRDRFATTGVNTVETIEAERGMEKAMLLMSAYVWLPPFNTALPSYRPGVDREFLLTLGGVTVPMPNLVLKDHADHEWTIYMYGNWFVRSTIFDDGEKVTNVDSITADLEVTDHQGIQWLATRFAPDRFRMTQVNPPGYAAVCPTVNGISTTRDSSCTVYFSNNINIKLAAGDNANLSLGVAPRIESSDSFFFPARTQSSFPVKVTGLPLPALQSNNLPPWLQLANGTLVGNPGTLAGKTIITLRVQTQSGSDQKAVTIYYGEPLQFMSSADVNVMAIEPLVFTINTAGTPRPKLTWTGWLPPGSSLIDNGNGTATLRLSWSGGFAPACFDTLDSKLNLVECEAKIFADNEAQRIEQQLHFYFHPAPDAVFQGPNELKFIAGVESRYLLTTRGARTPVEWQNPYGGRLRDDLVRSFPWLRFDERPDGTALVSGIPPMNGQSSSTSFNACPSARGSLFVFCGTLGVGNLNITVDGDTRFMSNTYGSVAVGRGSDIQLFVNRLNGNIGFSPYHILTSRFPKGLRLEAAPSQPNGMVTARILGYPEPGQGGRYEFMLNWTDQLTSVNSSFTLDVLEGAKITSPATFTFFEGSKAAGEVTMQGYPVNSAGVDCGPRKDCADMKMRLEWASPRRIAGLTLTDRTPGGIPTGVGRFGSAIPAGSSGVYEAFIYASNGPMAPEARQSIRLVVLPTADLNGDGKVDCSDLTAIKNAIGMLQPGPGRGFDLTGDMVVDATDIDAMVRAVPELFACQI